MTNFLTRLFGASEPKAPARIELESSDPNVWNNVLVQQCYLQMALGHRDIETTVDDPALAKKLMDRVIGQWRELSVEPYWSNDTSDCNKLANIDDGVIDNFYAAGREYMDVIQAFESRSGLKIADGLCVELGAGVGKHTHLLAKRFQRVVAVDVAGSLLDVLAARARQLGLDNITTAVLQSPDDVAKFGEIDFFMAQSVLQHNPPPIQKMILDSAFEKLKPGGFALFETPDWLEGYTFSSKRFVENAPDAACDCHCLPKTDVIRLIKSHGMELLDFAPDFNTQCFGSYTFFARKPPH